MNSPKQLGQFFVFPPNAALDIIRAGGGVEEIISLLVLYRGAGRFSSTKWSENAIRKHGGFTYSRATKALEFLAERRLITAKKAGDVEDKAHAGHKWQINKPDDGLIYLPNAIVDGVGGGKDHPPLARLYEDVDADIAKGINIHHARLDAVSLLLAFYAEQDIAHYGGVSPFFWSRPWEITGSEYIEPKTPIPNSNGVFYEIAKGDQQVFDNHLCRRWDYIQDETQRLDRYWRAVRNLKNLGLAYEVLQIWTGDPTAKRDAEVMYPLYIFDQRARTNEPNIYRDINGLAMDAMGAELFFDPYGESAFGTEIDTFRYVAVKNTNALAFSVLRLRYRPHDKDTGIGMTDQEKKAREWCKAARQLRGISDGFD